MRTATHPAIGVGRTELGNPTVCLRRNRNTARRAQQRRREHRHHSIRFPRSTRPSCHRPRLRRRRTRCGQTRNGCVRSGSESIPTHRPMVSSRRCMPRPTRGGLISRYTSHPGKPRLPSIHSKTRSKTSRPISSISPRSNAPGHAGSRRTSRIIRRSTTSCATRR
jgi:hypothetical protein